MKKSTRLTLAGVAISLALAGCAGGSKNDPPPPAPPPEPAPEAIPVETISIETDGFFAFDRYNIKPALATRLDGVAGQISGRAYSSVEIVGHTDSIGTEAYNQELSEKRASATADYLANAGVDGGKISSRGEGETNPIHSNDTAEGRAKNRRIEVTIR